MAFSVNIGGIGSKRFAVVWQSGGTTRSVQHAPDKLTPFLAVDVPGGPKRGVVRIGNPDLSSTRSAADEFRKAVAGADLTSYRKVRLGSVPPQEGHLFVSTDAGGAKAFAAIPPGKEPNIRSRVAAFHQELLQNGTPVPDR